MGVVLVCSTEGPYLCKLLAIILIAGHMVCIANCTAALEICQASISDLES